VAAVDPEFLSRAEAFLAEWTLKDALAAATRAGPGHWHPTGFVVFKTAIRFGDMPVRIHCWPAEDRRGDPDHPPLHTHMWPLASKVVLGTYVEATLQLEPSAAGPIRKYVVTYESEHQSTISPVAGQFEVAEYKVERYETGQIHHLPEGAWHQTLIPQHSCVVTVMVTGPAHLDEPRIAGPAELPEFTRRRVLVDPDFLRSEFGAPDR
jgi:hypothetical protein